MVARLVRTRRRARGACAQHQHERLDAADAGDRHLVGRVRAREARDGARRLGRALEIVLTLEQLDEHRRDVVLIVRVVERDRAQRTGRRLLRLLVAVAEEGHQRRDAARLRDRGLVVVMARREGPERPRRLELGVLRDGLRLEQRHQRHDAARGRDGRLVAGVLARELREGLGGLGVHLIVVRVAEQTDEGLDAARARDGVLRLDVAHRERRQRARRLALRLGVLLAQQLDEGGDRPRARDRRLGLHVVRREAPERARRLVARGHGAPGREDVHDRLDGTLGGHARLDVVVLVRDVGNHRRRARLGVFRLGGEEEHQRLDAAVVGDVVDVLLRIAREVHQHGRRQLLRLERRLAAAAQLQDEPADRARLGDGGAVVGVLCELDEHLRDLLLPLGGARSEQCHEAGGDGELVGRVVVREARQRADGLLLRLDRARAQQVDQRRDGARVDDAHGRALVVGRQLPQHVRRARLRGAVLGA